PSQNFIRSRNLGHYRPKCGPKQDRNFNSLFGRENSLFFAENSLFTPKNFPACSTGRSNFVTAWLYQSSRAIGISHMAGRSPSLGLIKIKLTLLVPQNGPSDWGNWPNLPSQFIRTCCAMAAGSSWPMTASIPARYSLDRKGS